MFARERGPALLANLARAVEDEGAPDLSPGYVGPLIACVSRLHFYGVDVPKVVVDLLLRIDEETLALAALAVVLIADDEVGIDFADGVEWLDSMRPDDAENDIELIEPCRCYTSGMPCPHRSSEDPS